jgi:hypothetical protein
LKNVNKSRTSANNVSLTVKASIIHLQCVILSETGCGKSVEAANNRNILQLLSLIQRSVTRSRVARAAHQAIENQGHSMLCAFLQFQHSSLLCYKSSINLQNLVKIKGVP